jgi:hypothetical protein
MMMTRRTQAALTLLPLVTAAVLWSAAVAAQQSAAAQGAPLNDAQVRALVHRAIAMQHRTYEALDLYDRTEHIVNRDGDDKPTDRTVRTVPVGASDVRVEINRDGQPVPPMEIADKWRYVLEVMEERTHRDDPDVKKEYEKAAKHRDDVTKMVDAIADAFFFHFAGRTMVAGRPVVELDYEPNPEFKSRLRFSGVYKQVYGKVWVDEASGAVVRLQAELRNDIPIGAGIIGKIYKGSRVELEQAEAVPGAGVWLPTLTSYDVAARKFVIPVSYHRQLYSSDYRRIGPPAEALTLLRNEHAQLFAPERTGN